MPVQLGLEFMTVVGANFAYPKGEFFDDMVDEVDGIGLGVFLVDLKCSDPSRVINGCVLETPYLFAAFSLEGQKPRRCGRIPLL